MKKTILLLLACLFVIFQHSLFFKDMYYNRDIAGYAYNTLEIMQGRGWYASTWHSKPPGSSLIYMIAFFLFGKSFIATRIVALLADLCTVFLLYFLGRFLFNKNAWESALLPVFFSLFCVSIDYSSHGMNLEVLVAAFETAGILLFCMAFNNGRNVFYFLSGLILGCGFMVKQSALITFLACLIFIFYNKVSDKEAPMMPAKSISIFIISFFVPVILSSVFFLSQGVFQEFFSYSFVIPFKHGRHIAHGIRFMGPMTKEFSFLGIESGVFGVLALAGGIRFWTEKTGSSALFLIWFTLCFVLAVFSPYEHYLVQLIVPLVCLSAVGFSWMYESFMSNMTVRVMLIVLVAIPFIHTIYISELEKSAVYEDGKERFLVSRYIKSMAMPQDKIFVWDHADGTSIYFWTGLQNVSHFRQKCSFLPDQLVQNYELAFSGDYKINQKRLLSDMKKELPVFIVIADDHATKLSSEENAFKRFFRLLNKKYRLVKKIGSLNIYRLTRMECYS